MATLTASIPMASTEISATFKKLVVAYDFSPHADTALDYALDLARKQSSEIILVHVQGSGDEASPAGDEGDEEHKAIPNLTERLQQLADHCRKKGVDARWLVRAGSTAESLAGVVADLRPDLLFLGAYGNNRQDRKVLGSTAESLLQTLPCPVVTIGPKALRAGVELVHAVDVCHEYSFPHNATNTQFEFDLLVEWLQQEGVEAQSTLLYGAPERVISERARAVNAHYIMFGLHQSGHFSSYSRKSLVAKVIRNAPCAIFTFAQSAGGRSLQEQIGKPMWPASPLRPFA
jgi:nucleotide-binding universal stress UspA family protein